MAPQQVLPLVVKRFQEALVSLSAAHQLVSALHTLSHCLRPLLLVGGPTLPVGTGDAPVCPCCILRLLHLAPVMSLPSRPELIALQAACSAYGCHSKGCSACASLLSLALTPLGPAVRDVRSRDTSTSLQVAVPEIIAQAMHAVLPGIDANDASKTLTVFNFLCILLSNLPQLPVSPCSGPQ